MIKLNFIKVNSEKAFLVSLLLIAVSLLIVFSLSGFVSVHQSVDDLHFAEGISIDGIDISGEGYEEARQQLEENAQAVLAEMDFTLVYAGEETVFDSNDLGITINYTDSLDEAYYYNKDEADSLEQRFNKTAELFNDSRYSSTVEINDEVLNKTIENYAAQYEIAAVDAAACFDKDTQTFTFTAEENGVSIDSRALVSQIESKVRDNDFLPLEVKSDVVYPLVKQSDLEVNAKLLASYETTAADSENRNTNIQLMCEAVDGAEIKPQGVFSVNEWVGERTEAKGFKAAPAIINGMTVDDIGGGICQLAGTLYNAALLADMEIVERIGHTWPSDYVPIGQDSTLNWDDKDLKIKNTTSYSMFISAKFEDQKVKVTIYGKPFEAGVTIAVQNEIVEELKPPKTEYRYTSELPSGFSETMRKGRTGYIVKVYRVYYKNGVETNRELISWDKYMPLGKIVLIGNNTQDK